MIKNNIAGKLRMFRKKLGEIMNIVFGRNSAMRRIRAVLITVFTISTERSDCRSGSRTGFRSREKKRP
jgi:hypothetical protein